ncbi:hypothetical protein SAMN06297251_1129 [Fulvimarina manganoxydans]|uniref:Uncharacterized protein n=1 Tax=Fulvimarina manganoxydans TaxID=937218 RepID=A0A1W2D0B7_9HYPH|nr:hypothetical protein [Fulvimarina manganoxydans]SMC90626.1 hypothetical protein SAMN06297251_1129 [Fulvimarina manganoxydans]
MIRLGLFLTLGGLLFGIAPVALAIGAGTLGASLGCEVNEGSIHPCPLWGYDIGETLYQFGVLGWLGLMTLPIGLPIAAIGLLLLLGALCRRLYAAARTG